MWSREFSRVYSSVSKEEVWKVFANVLEWPKWDSELSYCDMRDSFEAGSCFILKPKQGPKVKIIVSEVEHNRSFTTYCKFIGAKMFHEHKMEETQGDLRITQTVTVKGPLAFIWTALIAKKLADVIPQQTDRLIEWVKGQRDG